MEEKRLVEKKKLDPQTKRPVLDAQGKPVMEETEVTVKRFRVVPVFDVSQTEGKELPSLAKELQGNVADYDLLFEAMKSVSPVPIEFKAMKAGKDGYYHLKDKKIALRQGMSEIQAVATAIHEISHAKLHDRALQQRGAKDTEQVKDSRTQEVEAESIAYAVCQYYGIETADNSFGYLAGWSSDKDLSELKASLQTIRDTASELITSIDEKVFNLKQEFEIEAPKTREAAVKAVNGKVAALAEALEDYQFEALPAGEVSLENGEIRPWLETVLREDRSPYTTQAAKLLQQIDQIQEDSASYLLENGERLALLREGEQWHYSLQDSLQTPIAEGFVSEPDLMLEAAKDLSLSEAGRDGITATLLTNKAREQLEAPRVSEPMVSFSRSQHPEISDGLVLPLSQANRLMERLDQRQAIGLRLFLVVPVFYAGGLQSQIHSLYLW